MKKKALFYKVPAWILLAIGILLVNSANWFFSEWGDIDFAVVLYQLSSPLKGTESGIVQQFVATAAVSSLWETCLIIAVDCFCNICFSVLRIEFNGRIFKKRFKLTLNAKWAKWFLRIMYLVITGLVIVLLIVDVIKMGIPEYVEQITHPSTIFEERYVDPNDVTITFPEEKKNVVYIYLESMETSYASRDVGGAKPYNYIPNLTAYARENVSFKSSSLGGGLNTATGSSWTMGALLSSTSGVPYLLPLGNNQSEKFQLFLPGITSMGQILENEGYSNYFMCGSYAEFGGRYQYFKQHGSYEFFDYNRAKDDGIIDKDYYVFWGYEDSILYDWAKSVLPDIAAEDGPFNFTMLTVDSHYPDGYICELCEDIYPEQYANAIACADRQVKDFVEWLQEQEWYEDTVVVIVGDHLTMSNTFWDDLPEGYVRQTYNCIINSDAPYSDPTRLENRTAFTMDLFPTVLSAMGVEIEGDRLGLGTNLFSPVDTLAEEMGKEVFEEEVAKYSRFYNEEFIHNK